MSIRVGVFGGVFDPVHKGHIEAARVALSTLVLDRLHLVPCNLPSHRPPALSQSADRLAMLELAVSAETGLVVDPIEVEREVVSYSIDTLKALHEKFEDAHLVFVLGMDAFNSLPTWHHWPELFVYCHFFVLARNGELVSAATAEAVGLKGRRVDFATDMFQANSGKIWIQEDFEFDLSSTMVREAIKRHDKLDALLNSKVIEYIDQHNLYH